MPHCKHQGHWFPLGYFLLLCKLIDLDASDNRDYITFPFFHYKIPWFHIAKQGKICQISLFLRRYKDLCQLYSAKCQTSSAGKVATSNSYSSDDSEDLSVAWKPNDPFKKLHGCMILWKSHWTTFIYRALYNLYISKGTSEYIS